MMSVITGINVLRHSNKMVVGTGSTAQDFFGSDDVSDMIVSDQHKSAKLVLRQSWRSWD